MGKTLLSRFHDPHAPAITLTDPHKRDKIHNGLTRYHIISNWSIQSPIESCEVEFLVAVHLLFILIIMAQVKEKKAIKEEQKRLERERAMALFERIRQQEEEEKQKVIRQHEKKMSFRATLDAQMKDNARRKVQMLMSEEERKINTKLLTKVKALQITGETEADGTSLMPLNPNNKKKFM